MNGVCGISFFILISIKFQIFVDSVDKEFCRKESHGTQGREESKGDGKGVREVEEGLKKAVHPTGGAKLRKRWSGKVQKAEKEQESHTWSSQRNSRRRRGRHRGPLIHSPGNSSRACKKEKKIIDRGAQEGREEGDEGEREVTICGPQS